jgi:hypothetical protein
MEKTPEDRRKKSYQAPALRKYGTIGSLTQSLEMKAGVADNSMGASNKKT